MTGIFAPYVSPRSIEDAPSLPHARASSADIESDEMPSYPHGAIRLERESSVSEFKAAYMPQYRDEPESSFHESFLFREFAPLENNSLRSQSVHSRYPIEDNESFASLPRTSFHSKQKKERRLSFGDTSQYQLSIEGFRPPPVRSLHPAGLKPTVLDRVTTNETIPYAAHVCSPRYITRNEMFLYSFVFTTGAVDLRYQHHCQSI